MNDFAPTLLSKAFSIDTEILTDALDPDAALRSLLLSLMSRLLVTKGLAARCEGERIGVDTVFGLSSLNKGDELDIGLSQKSIATGKDVSHRLRENGFTLVIPLRYNSEAVGLIALGPRGDGRPFSQEQLAVTRSLAGVAAVAIRAAQTGRMLAGRAQDLQTLLEMATAFGECVDRKELASRLVYAAMGRWMTRKAVVALTSEDDAEALVVSVQRGLDRVLSIPSELAEANEPSAIDEPALKESGLEWSVPLRAGDTARGVLLLGGREGDRPYPASDSAFASALAALAVGALEALDRVEERVVRERLEHEMHLALQIQEQLLPDEIPSLPGFDIAAAWRPGTTVSGDFYDVALLGKDRVLFAIADGMGHGAPAALLAATLQSGLRLIRDEAAQFELDLETATSRLNTLLCDSIQTSQFVTMAWGILESDGTVNFVTAGHPPPRLVRSSGSIEELTDGGPLLGVVPDAVYSSGSARLEPGDRLVLFTDGISEAENHKGKQFGTRGIDEAMALTSSTAASVVAEFLDAVDEHSDPSREVDDRTVVLLQRDLT